MKTPLIYAGLFDDIYLQSYQNNLDNNLLEYFSKLIQFDGIEVKIDILL